jgi:hypothetical protein
LGHAGADFLAHEFRVYSQGGNPGTFGFTKSSGQNVADHKPDNFALMFRNETGSLFALGVFFYNTFEIRFNRPPRDRCVNPGDLFCIFNP